MNLLPVRSSIRQWARWGRARAAAAAACTIAVAACATTSPPPAAQAGAPAADLLYVGGRVLTMDPAGSVAQAVAVRDGRVVAVGSDVMLRRFSGPSTRVVELGGRTLAPGFFAPHDHFPGAGTVARHYVDLNSPPIGRIESIDQLVEALRARAATIPAGGWVVGRGYDDTLLREGRHPTRADLDRVSTEHPVWINHISGHLGVANSRALQIAAVTRDTKQPAGGRIRIDPATGDPNGVLEEAGSLITRHIPAFTRDQRLEAMEWANDEYLSRGVTTIVIAGNSGRQKLEDMMIARERGLLDLRVITMASRATRAAPATKELLNSADPDLLRLGAVKVIQDGSIQGFTGYLSEPYHTHVGDDTTYSGYPRRDREALIEMIVRIHCEGTQAAIHANGDAAIDDALAAIAAAQAQCARPDTRHRIEHAQMARPDQLQRMAALGVTPSIFVGHVYYWGDRHRDIFLGPERGARISPLRTATEAGLRWTVHDDTPVTPVNPLQLVWVAANRLTTSGELLGGAERVTPEQALRAVTSDAAWQNFAEESRGSIEPGRLADFVVLSDDPLGVPPETIRDIRVLETIVGGRTVWRRAD